MMRTIYLRAPNFKGYVSSCKTVMIFFVSYKLIIHIKTIVMDLNVK